jgi:hypothetical protein
MPMSQGLAKASSRQNRLGVSGLAAVGVLLLAAIVMLAFGSDAPPTAGVPRQSAADAPFDANRNSGSIVLRQGVDGQCRRLQFDNGTGALRQQGPEECKTQTTPGPNSTEGRMNAIRGAFSKK